uniref:APOPT family protein CG14806, mitochondrial n=2 Tax=Cacopsylla melanoneura TaxID=428564 RepID=A0A8D8ZKA7_9HEMI
MKTSLQKALCSLQIHNTKAVTVRMLSSKNDPLTQSCDVIGKPDAISNLRPYKFHIPATESNIERTYRQERETVQSWNQEFWMKHNIKFTKEREQYIDDMKVKLAHEKNCSKDEIVVTADEMSVFYKTFLDKHWYIHMNYNLEWYKRNAKLIVLSIQTNMYKLYKKFV